MCPTRRCGGRSWPNRSIDRSALDDPLGWLSGDGGDVVEVRVVVEDRERGGLGGRGDEEIGDLASFESVGGEVALNLMRTVEVMCLDIDSPEGSERNGEAVPFVSVALREADIEVTRTPA